MVHRALTEFPRFQALAAMWEAFNPHKLSGWAELHAALEANVQGENRQQAHTAFGYLAPGHYAAATFTFTV